MSQVGERKGKKVQYVIIIQTNPQQKNRFLFFYLLSYIVQIFTYLFYVLDLVLVLYSSLTISSCSQFSPVLHFILLYSICLPALHVVILPLNSSNDIHPLLLFCFAFSCLFSYSILTFHYLFLVMVFQSPSSFSLSLSCTPQLSSCVTPSVTYSSTCL